MAYQPRMDDFSQVPQAPPATLLFSTYHAIGNVAGRTDAQGNEFIAVQINFARSNDSVIYVRKYSPTGQMLAHKTFPHYNADKHDALALYSAGRNLIILHGGHDTPNPVPPEGRENPVGRSVWEGVYEPFPPGQEPDGGANSWVGEPEPNPEVDVTPQEVVDAFAASLNTNSALRRNLYQLLSAAQLDTLYSEEADPIVLDEGELDQRIRTMLSGTSDLYSSPGLFSRLDQTIYGTVNKVLDEREGRTLAELDTTEEEPS